MAKKAESSGWDETLAFSNKLEVLYKIDRYNPEFATGVLQDLLESQSESLVFKELIAGGGKENLLRTHFIEAVNRAYPIDSATMTKGEVLDATQARMRLADRFATAEDRSILYERLDIDTSTLEAKALSKETLTNVLSENFILNDPNALAGLDKITKLDLINYFSKEIPINSINKLGSAQELFLNDILVKNPEMSLIEFQKMVREISATGNTFKGVNETYKDIYIKRALITSNPTLEDDALNIREFFLNEEYVLREAIYDSSLSVDELQDIVEASLYHSNWKEKFDSSSKTLKSIVNLRDNEFLLNEKWHKFISNYRNEKSLDIRLSMRNKLLTDIKDLTNIERQEIIYKLTTYNNYDTINITIGGKSAYNKKLAEIQADILKNIIDTANHDSFILAKVGQHQEIVFYSGDQLRIFHGLPYIDKLNKLTMVPELTFFENNVVFSKNNNIIFKRFLSRAEVDKLLTNMKFFNKTPLDLEFSAFCPVGKKTNCRTLLTSMITMTPESILAKYGMK